MTLDQISTPAALVDMSALRGNIARMQTRMDALGVALRPHVKTAKSVPIAALQMEAGARGITVSTLKEAEQFFAAGISDILYAVGMAPSKLRQAASLVQRGCALKIIADNADSARAIAQFFAENAVKLPTLIEIDTDGHRAGVLPESEELLAIGRILHRAGVLHGVMTHAGGSYACSTPEALAAFAEQERSRCVRAAQRLREAGLPCACVSVGSTPTALSATQLDGVTEVRAGVYVFFDLVMQNIGVCSNREIALSVLTTVIGHQKDKGWALVDAGWMAMSRDRGTQRQACDFGYGQVCDAQGQPLEGWIMESANQEHGILVHRAGATADVAQLLPVGTLLRIQPNHACATSAQFPEYQMLEAGAVKTSWPRFYGW